jgi:hypothetical protein
MRPPKQSDRAFGLMFAGVFAVLYLVAWLGFDHPLTWALVVSGLFLAVALAVPGLLMPLNRLWGRLAGGLGFVNNHILLGFFFYVFVTPLALVLRLGGWDPMTRTLGKGEYWHKVGRQANSETFSDMF